MSQLLRKVLCGVACLAIVALTLSPKASAQSIWKKMKIAALQQACRGGDQQACQQLVKLGQAPPRPAQQQPGQPAPRPGERPQPGQVQNDSGPFKPPAGTKVVEQVMAPIQSDAKFYISPHGVHIATVENAGSRAVVYYDGAPGLKFDEILDINNNGSNDSGIQIAFSPDGKRYAYCARSGADIIVMVDGKQLTSSSGPPAANGSWPCSLLGFTSNSQHSVYRRVVYAPPKGGYGYVQFQFDGKSAPLASDLNNGGGGIDPVFSPDGNRYAYIDHDPARTNKWALVIDGKVAPYLGGNPQWSADSQHLYTTLQHSGPHPYAEAMLDGKPFLRDGYQIELHLPPQGNMVVAKVMAVGPQGRRQEFLVIGGKKVLGSELAGVGTEIDKITFSPDGRHFAARLTIDQNRQAVLMDGKRLQEYHGIRDVAFTADSSKVIYTANDSHGKAYVVYGDQESDTCFADFDNGISIAPVGNRSAAICGLTGGAPTMFIDGKMLKFPSGVRGASQLSFSPNGQHYVYVEYEQGGGQRLAIDGVVQTASDLHADTDLSPYVISPDSAHIAAPSGGTGIFLDGKFISTGSMPRLDSLGFTPDSKHIFWAQGLRGGVNGRARMAFYVDGKMVAEMLSVVGPNTKAKHERWWDVAPDGTLSVLSQDDNSLKRITITPSPNTSIQTLLAVAR